VDRKPLRFPALLDVLAMHQEIMARYGQPSEMRSDGEALLESAMMRPYTAAHYEGADLAKQAALLMLGIAQAHPFTDGNKRVTFAAGMVLLQLNGYLVSSRPREFGERIVAALTSGDRAGAADALADWIRERLRPLNERG
jgi:death-on-curing protein